MIVLFEAMPSKRWTDPIETSADNSVFKSSLPSLRDHVISVTNRYKENPLIILITF